MIPDRTWAKLCELFGIFFLQEGFWDDLFWCLEPAANTRTLPRQPQTGRLAFVTDVCGFTSLIRQLSSGPNSLHSCHLHPLRSPHHLPLSFSIFAGPLAALLSLTTYSVSQQPTDLLLIYHSNVVILCFWAYPKCLSAPDTAGQIWGGAASSRLTPGRWNRVLVRVWEEGGEIHMDEKANHTKRIEWEMRGWRRGIADMKGVVFWRTFRVWYSEMSHQTRFTSDMLPSVYFGQYKGYFVYFNSFSTYTFVNLKDLLY